MSPSPKEAPPGLNPRPGTLVWYDGRPFRLVYELVIGVWMATPLFVEAPDEEIPIAESKPCKLHGSA